jgi:dUTP pyrophosphatase
MKIKFKKLSDKAVAPQIMRSGDCGADLTATSITETDMYIEYGTDLAVVVPENHVGILAPRSSLSNYDLILSNSIGVIDQNYRGELRFRFKKNIKSGDACGISFKGTIEIHNLKHKYYKIGDRIGQLLIIPLPVVEYEEVQELDETNRGANGFGSSNV